MNSFGNKRPQDTRIVVAMSGGVDSSVTAALLVEQGFDVVGITLQLYDHGLAMGKKGACCAGQDIYDARQVAERLSIPHYVLDYESKFSDAVMQEFADSYLAGETPIPCIRCNERVKFRDLLDQARELGAEAMATGHYVRRIEAEGGPELHRGNDPMRDQSYFLFSTNREQLDFLRFPLGNLEKSETRSIAQRHNLSVADKPDSQDICFVPDGNYTKIVRSLRPGAEDPGEIYHIDGRRMGEHNGIIHFTIGQRRGIGVFEKGSSNDPLYVVRIDAKKKRVVVGPKSALAVSAIQLREVNWLGHEDVRGRALDLDVKIRSVGTMTPARLSLDENGKAAIRFKEPQFGVSPGQACVFYQDTRVLGGGWMIRPENE